MRFNGISKSRIDAADAEFVLTDDERDVLALSRCGKSVVAISMALGMGERTVKRHRASITRKLNNM